MTLTITATVGRNLNGVALTVEHWEALQRRVRNALTYATTGKGKTETHYGVGTWDGVTEESVKITRYGTAWRRSTDYITEGYVWLRAELGEIARVYRQDAIALVIGEGELITPLPLPPLQRAFAGAERDWQHRDGAPAPVRRCSCNRANYGDAGHDGNRHPHALGDRGPTRQDSAPADRVALDFV